MNHCPKQLWFKSHNSSDNTTSIPSTTNGTLLHTATRLIVALMLSASLIRGSERQRHQGLDDSPVFSVFGLGLRGSCLFFACCGGRNGVVAHVGVFCTVNVMKWVVFMVYFNNCKRQSLGRKVDDEVVGDNGLTNAKTAYDVHDPPDGALDFGTC